MKRIKAINGYTIFQATARDIERYNVNEGTYYIYISSDIRAYGLACSYPEWEEDSLEIAEMWCKDSNYAQALEIVETTTTAATLDEIEAVEALLDAGIAPEDIEPKNIPEITIFQERGLYYLHIETTTESFDHGPYFTHDGAIMARKNYIINTYQEEK